MALGFSFQLTPRQTELLLSCVYGHYVTLGNGSLLPEHTGDMVMPGRRLIDKGLLSHDNSRNPTGRAIAEMIVSDARKIANMADTATVVKSKPVATRKN